MNFLLFIIVVIVLIYQNGKITALENLVKKGNPHQAPAPQPTLAPMTQSAASVVPVKPISAQAPFPSQTPLAPQKPPVSSEEMSGRILGRIGIGALVIGVGFFLKYAYDNDWISYGGRVFVGIVIGVALLSIGQWLRKKYLSYSDLLMGGGLAVLYLSVYSAYALYGIIDPMMAFMGLIVVTAVGVGISIVNATQTLSVVAVIGGYITPALIGVALLGPWIIFTYLTILNAGILGVLIYKKWAPLVIIGIIGTWLHFGSWLVLSYTDDLLMPTLFFILVQFLIFTGASVTRLVLEKAKSQEIDIALLSITAVTFAGATYHLLMPEYKEFFSLVLVAVAFLYGAIAILVRKENPTDEQLNIFLPGLSVAFLTAAVAVEFSGAWVAAWWFVEALVLYIVASRSSSRGYQVMGVVVYVLGLMRLMVYIVDYQMPAGFVLFFNTPFMMLALAVGTAYAIAFVYWRYGSVSEEIRMRGVSAFAVIANVLTLYALTSQINAYYDLAILHAGYMSDYSSIHNTANTTVSIAWALYAIILTVIGFAKKYAVVRIMGLVLFIITACKVVIDVWSLGQIYRIVSFIVFGIIALVASFMYVKYKDRLKEIV